MKSKIVGMGVGLAMATLGIVAVPVGLAYADTTTAPSTCYTGCSAPQQVTPPVTEPPSAPVTTPAVVAPTQAPTSSSLPFTGADIEGMAAIGAGALVLGGVLVRRSRRHGHAAA
ncbi:MAG TPA: hypothetical protein VMB72_15170 [Acidimicrobiales bacterium]|nr:hypothetical protein [Acidimicrobiales bacterium]